MIRTKIFATLGPASSSEVMLRKMFLNGLDGVRLNFSHGTHKGHIQNIKIVRTLNKKLRRAIKIMQDLEGYRIRVGRLSGPVKLHKGKSIYITQESIIGNDKEFSFDYAGSLKRIKRGALIYIDDGKILLKVTNIEKRRLKAKIAVAGELWSHKGINITGVALNFNALTAKDKKDVKIAIDYKLDYVAQSFVRNARDIKLLRSIVESKHPSCKIFAKVENKEALINIDEIIDEADGIIVARGDLGVCLPIYKVPVLQKEIIKKCHLKNKPAMVATQMLDSMTHESMPTRAEVSDVANAIMDGASHLLLSQETAIGQHPHKVIDMMNKVVRHTELYQGRLHSLFD